LWPDDGGGDGGKVFAALDELMKDVVVGRVFDEWIKGDCFSQGG
jgi:hypothetical protein